MVCAIEFKQKTKENNYACSETHSPDLLIEIATSIPNTVKLLYQQTKRRSQKLTLGEKKSQEIT